MAGRSNYGRGWIRLTIASRPAGCWGIAGVGDIGPVGDAILSLNHG